MGDVRPPSALFQYDDTLTLYSDYSSLKIKFEVSLISDQFNNSYFQNTLI